MKKAFTLIELIAVIIILAVIALISTPIVLNVIEKTRREAYKNSSLNVFKGAELYQAKNNFLTIPKDGLGVSELELENNNFISGKIIKNDKNELEIVDLSDGVYCAKGVKNDIKIVKGSCILLDETAPIDIVISLFSATSNSIKIVVGAKDSESGIKQYYYSLDGINYKVSPSSTIEIKGLENGKTYKVYIKVENNNGIISNVVEKEITTEEIASPTYSIDKTGWQTKKIVTITYPERQTGFVYEYSIDSGTTWVTVESGITKDITFTSNGSVIARVYDGVNYKTASSYTVSQIDTIAPTLTLTGSATISVEKGEMYTEPGYSATDTGGSGLNGSVVVSGTVNITGSSNSATITSDSSHYVGGLVASAYNVTISNSYNTGSVTGYASVGGLVGRAAFKLVINNSYNTGNISASGSFADNVGGLVGTIINSSSTITNCYSTGNVLSTGKNIGGLVGSNIATITKSYASGEVKSTYNGSPYTINIGGLVGENKGSITDSYALGNVVVTLSVGENIGGLVGNNSGTISRVYSVGRITGSSNSKLGPALGYNNSGNISYVYWNSTIAGKTTANYGTGLTTTQMYTSGNFTGFNFVNTWYSSGSSYPTLR